MNLAFVPMSCTIPKTLWISPVISGEDKRIIFVLIDVFVDIMELSHQVVALIKYSSSHSMETKDNELCDGGWLFLQANITLPPQLKEG